MDDLARRCATDLPDWTLRDAALHTRFRTGDFAAGLRLVAALGAAAEAADHHPEIALSYGRVDVRLSSHDVGAVTGRDLALAARFSALAAEQGIAAEPVALTSWPPSP